MKSTKIKLIDINKKFPNGTGINNLNLEIPSDKIIGFVGNNGAGKTTTIRTILGELKPDHGNLEYYFEKKGNPIKNIAFFPDQNNFPKNFNIVDFARYTANLKFIDRKTTEEELTKWIKLLELEKWVKNSFKDLSTGLQKRALLLSVLICNPEVIIFDEPTANLDVDSRIEFLNIIKEINSELNTTILITSHILEELEEVINHVIIINNGEIKYSGDFGSDQNNLKELYKQFVNKERIIDFKQVKFKGGN